MDKSSVPPTKFLTRYWSLHVTVIEKIVMMNRLQPILFSAVSRWDFIDEIIIIVRGFISIIKASKCGISPWICREVFFPFFYFMTEKAIVNG